MFARATLDGRTAERLFGAPLSRFRTDDGTSYLAPVRQVRIPAYLAGAITGVVGLDTRPLVNRAAMLAMRSSSATASAAAQQSSELPRTGTPAGCAAGQAAGESGGDPSTAAFTPNQYLTAYGFDTLHNAGFQGQGQRVALVELDSVRSSDVSAFAQCFGFPAPPVSQHLVGLSAPPAAGLETTLDLDALTAGAPKLSGVDVYETGNDPASFVSGLTAPLQSPGRMPRVMSVSIGVCDNILNVTVGAAGRRTADLAFYAAAASGVTVVAASGDNGSTGCIDQSGTPAYNFSVDYPASSINATGVGGTNLSLTPGNRIANEVVWNDAPARLAAGGGGFSDEAPRPLWQLLAVPANIGVLNTGSGSLPVRAVPDVSMLADLRPGYAVYCSTGDCAGAAGPWIAAGGTSAAAPLLAGGLAIVDQAIRARQRDYLGQVTPFLYGIGASSARNFVFHDVITGSNDISAFLPGSGGQAIGCCSAFPGYDRASGWGSIDITHLADIAALWLPNSHVRIAVKLAPHQHPVSSRQIAATLSCTTDCYGYAVAKVTIAGGQQFEVRSTLQHLTAAGSRKVILPFTEPEVARVHKALRKHQRILATVYGEIYVPGFVNVVYKQSAGKRLAVLG